MNKDHILSELSACIDRLALRYSEDHLPEPTRDLVRRSLTNLRERIKHDSTPAPIDPAEYPYSLVGGVSGNVYAHFSDKGMAEVAVKTVSAGLGRLLKLVSSVPEIPEDAQYVSWVEPPTGSGEVGNLMMALRMAEQWAVTGQGQLLSTNELLKLIGGRGITVLTESK